MTISIDEVIRESIIALYSSKILEKTNPLILKGGTALRLIENIKVRMSTDIDFSIAGKLSTPEHYFEIVKQLLSLHYKKIGFEVIDVKYRQKPLKRSAKTPLFWGGWEFTFKLSNLKNKNQTSAFKTRNAIIPDGSNSPVVALEISEHEFCASVQKVRVNQIQITSYSSVALVAEKLRAICQAHPDYPYSGSKDRARDYLDLSLMVKKYHSAEFYKKLKIALPDIFIAKEVPLTLLDQIFSDEFSAFQKNHFQALKEQVGMHLESFEFYQEQVKSLIANLVLK